MKNSVGKHIARLRKERKLSQEQLAGSLHVTRQAVSFWETGRSQPDLDMLEALAEALQTDILTIIYGKLFSQEQEERMAAERKRHLRMTVVAAAVSIAAVILTVVLSKYLREVGIRTYNSWHYIMFRSFVSPLAGTALGVTTVLMLGLVIPVRISDIKVRKKLLAMAIVPVPLYTMVTLWAFGLLPIPVGIPVYIWYLIESIFPQALFFFIGVLLYLGLEKSSK